MGGLLRPIAFRTGGAVCCILAAANLWVIGTLRAEETTPTYGATAETSYPAPIAPDDVSSLTVQPEDIRLTGLNRQQHLLVTAHGPGGRDVDVTHHCTFLVEDSSIAAIGESVLEAVSDGRTRVIVRYGSVERDVPVDVLGAAVYPPVHFANDILPLLTKRGCNSGGCHGKASGQNGFKLSVFGFDPLADYTAIVHDGRGRRVFPPAPERSLFVKKSEGTVPHGGGKRIEAGSPEQRLLVEWIRQGCPIGRDDAPHAVEIDVQPRLRVMDMQAGQQILVTAVYSDGSRRDVTSQATYSSNTGVIAEVDKGGRIHTGKLPGEAAITVNYMGLVDAVRVLIPRADVPETYPDVPEYNQIDTLVWSKLRSMGIIPSELCDDATFVRRAHLDAIGTLPSAETVKRFLADTDPDKRSRLIEALLERPEYADYWALKWANILMINSDRLGERGAYEFHGWLRNQIAKNRPYDEWVRELLVATGNSGDNGPVNFYRMIRSPEDATKTVSQALLGVRLDCAQCHHHPWEKWGQDDYYGMAGFFNGIEYKVLRREGRFGVKRELVYHSGHQPSRHPQTDAVVPTRVLAGAAIEDFGGVDPRVALADWLTAEDNPWFARLSANRIWKHYLGRGLVEPEDDFRSTNPPTNEPLLDYLSGLVVSHDFDLKALMREVMNSRVYQLSSTPNETNAYDKQNFSHYYVKRIPAEPLLDAICKVTEVDEDLPGMPQGSRAIEVWDNDTSSYFLSAFGRSDRTSPCECGTLGEPTMAQALHLINAEEIVNKTSHPHGRVSRMIEAGLSPDEFVEEMCYVALGRAPGDYERGAAERFFEASPPKQAAEDFTWALLNSYEFLFID